jgi:hypothetical protein
MTATQSKDRDEERDSEEGEHDHVVQKVGLGGHHRAGMPPVHRGWHSTRLRVECRD